MIWDLPTSIEVKGTRYEILPDFRNVLKILMAYADPNLSNGEKQFICLYNLYKDFAMIPAEDLNEAYKKAVRFIDQNEEPGKDGPRTMDWEQDANLLFPAVNKAAGFEVRTCPFMHWWTFLGYFMEIKDTTYSSVLSLRQKKAKGKKLEKWEKEYWNSNKKICQLHTKLTEEEIAEKERLNALLG